MSQFVILIKGGNPDDSNREEIGVKWGEWLEKAKEEGKYQSGLPFMEQGHEVASSGVSDHRSDIGAYMLMEHSDLEEALHWASQLPNLNAGGSASVHEVQSMG